jgi:hypothetical protein
VRRWALTFLSALSLLLCVATVALWVHSHFRTVIWGYAGNLDADGFTRTWELSSSRGRICWQVVWHWESSIPGDAGFRIQTVPSKPFPWSWRPSATKSYAPGDRFLIGRFYQERYVAAGFYYDRFIAPAVAWDRRSVAVPNWFLIAIFLVLPLMRWLNRPRPPGSCPVCGYDLRATPDRCPECGNA